ncbi:MAG TPA: hypothetical protein VIH28_11990 [Ignavibacteriaceae bacterium]
MAAQLHVKSVERLRAKLPAACLAYLGLAEQEEEKVFSDHLKIILEKRKIDSAFCLNVGLGEHS